MKIVGKLLIQIFANIFVACGQEAGKSLFGKRSFTVIPNAIDVDKFLYDSDESQRKLRDRLSMDNTKLQICHIGRFNDVKNHDFIIDIAQELSRKGIDFQLHLLGNGELFDTIKNRANTLGLDNIMFHGSVSNANDYLKASDLFILPSKHEGLPVTLVEAQCSGIQCFIADNITTEVDFGVNLIKYIPLELTCWADEIARFKKRDRCEGNKEILESIESRGYSVRSGTMQVLRLYGCKNNNSGEHNDKINICN